MTGKTFHNPVAMQVENIQLQRLWFYFDLVERTQKHNTYILVYFFLSNSSGWNPQEPKYLSIAQGYTYCQAPSTPHWNTSVEVRGAKGHCIICICKSHSGLATFVHYFLWWTPWTVVPKNSSVNRTKWRKCGQGENCTQMLFMYNTVYNCIDV